MKQSCKFDVLLYLEFLFTFLPTLMYEEIQKKTWYFGCLVARTFMYSETKNSNNTNKTKVASWIISNLYILNGNSLRGVEWSNLSLSIFGLAICKCWNVWCQLKSKCLSVQDTHFSPNNKTICTHGSQLSI